MGEQGPTRAIAEWAASLRFEDIPPRVIEKTKAQAMSVVGAIHEARHSEATQAALQAARGWGSGDDSTVLLTGERLPRLSALFVNACASVSFDFDDYLFAGHTGHSSVLPALAYGEHLGTDGREAMVAMVIANEVGGRLGASLLFGPHNGQMWAYIHQLEAACAVSRLLGLDADGIANAIGIAFTQPVHPLMPAFMGPDSKLLLPSATAVDGARAAELAAAGWTGSTTILEDRQGFLRRFNENHLGWMLSGFGSAWLTDSLCYKVVPGCAYIDTAVDAMLEIFAAFQADEGRLPTADDVADVEVACGLYTMGMETLCRTNRPKERLAPIAVNFSVALSFGLMLQAGGLYARHLSHAYLDEHRDAIEQTASKVRLEHTPAMDARAASAAESGGFSLRSLLSRASSAGSPELAEALDRARDVAGEAGPSPKSLDGVSFEGYRMAFPAEVTLTTASGRTYTAAQEIPRGGCGRPWDETTELVRRKLTGPMGEAGAAALGAIGSMDATTDARALASALAGAG